MSVVNAIPLLLGDEGYNISRSVRLRSSASGYFNRTPASAGNQSTWTWSGWVKRGSLGATYQMLFGADSGGGGGAALYFYNDNLCFGQFTTTYRVSTAVFRDPSAWYHVVCALDTTQATANNRVRIYVNGVELTSFTTTNNPTQNSTLAFNGTVAHAIGADIPNTGARNFLDGYLTEINFVNAQGLGASSFGETDAITGVWKPKKYAGTYGTNGFYLNFSDNSNNTAATIGKDYSGNGNNWTPNNISVTAGVTYDSMIDVPTLYADGGNGRGNYAVLNPLNNPAVATFADANLKVTNAASDYRGALSTMAIPSSGKWYWEFQMTSNAGGVNIANIGIAPLGIPLSGNQNGYSNSAAWYMNAGTTWISGGVSVGASTTTTLFQIAYDADTRKVWLGRDNVWYWGNTTTNNTTGDPAGGNNPSFTLTTAEFYAWAFAYANGFIANFGQRPFAYTPPTGFKALNTQNLPAPTILKGNQYFDATTYTGNAGTNAITNSGLMRPDFVWIKSRGFGDSHALLDSVRGGSNSLYSNATNAENAFSADVAPVTFNSNGFTVTGTGVLTNRNAASFVGWQWKANGSAVTNTSGSITSQVSAGTSQGFSVVTYTGNNTNGASVGHGLGIAPSMVFYKQRTNSSTNWLVWHRSVSQSIQTSTTIGLTGFTGALYLNLTNASSTYGFDAQINGSSTTHVAYCFSEVAGFSRFGSYTGNGSADGPFVFCGFRPRYVLIKRTDSTGDWFVFDTARNTVNTMSSFLRPNWSDAEATNTNHSIDFLSNGFKSRAIDTGVNASGGTFIYMAFAESPFRTSLAR